MRIGIRQGREGQDKVSAVAPKSTVQKVLQDSAALPRACYGPILSSAFELACLKHTKREKSPSKNELTVSACSAAEWMDTIGRDESEAWRRPSHTLTAMGWLAGSRAACPIGACWSCANFPVFWRLCSHMQTAVQRCSCKISGLCGRRALSDGGELAGLSAGLYYAGGFFE